MQFQRRVGVFVAVCLCLVGGLMLAFSKGASFFERAYHVHMQLGNVGGLKERSAVFLLGIQVGHLQSVGLATNGHSVVLKLRLLKKYPIGEDARFSVEQVGVLGDQFVSIYPGTNSNAPLLKDGDWVKGSESFSLQEMARSAGDVMKELSGTLAEVRHVLNEAGGGVANVRRIVLDPQTLSNLSTTIGNFRHVSEQTVTAMDDIAVLVQTNTQPISRSVSNLVRLTERAEQLTAHLDETILTNRANLGTAVSNFQQASASLKEIAAGLENGQGLAGSVLKDPQLQAQVAQSISNLAVLSSNLNRYGLLYKPKPVRAKNPAETTYHGKTW
jgi:phospholipid/cholesterol/gamma-HCH transport system substrate-binding protein